MLNPSPLEDGAAVCRSRLKIATEVVGISGSSAAGHSELDTATLIRSDRLW
jgi:hypothetical protein